MLNQLPEHSFLFQAQDHADPIRSSFVSVIQETPDSPETIHNEMNNDEQGGLALSVHVQESCPAVLSRNS